MLPESRCAHRANALFRRTSYPACTGRARARGAADARLRTPAYLYRTDRRTDALTQRSGPQSACDKRFVEPAEPNSLHGSPLGCAGVPQ